MTAETLTLTDFLLARIAEDEVDAKAAIAHQRALLKIKPEWSVVYVWAMMLNSPGGRAGGSHNFQPGAPSPARVLAECTARRAIVDLHEGDHDCVRYVDPADNNPCETLQHLAAVYADHPDYRGEWHL